MRLWRTVLKLIRTLVNGARVRWDNLFIHPVCNLRRDRAPVICGICFPLCWRCTAILAGFLATRFSLPRELNGPHAILPLFLVFPCGVDGVLQYFLGIESTNKRRIASGLLAGIGFAIFQ
jgi:uncharacterized membrane protein